MARTAVMLIGLGGLAAGIVGILLPASHRLGAMFALVAGAGVGVIMLAVLVTDADSEPSDGDFLIAAAAGLVAVTVGLIIAWRAAYAARSQTEHSVR
jgi:hypothetical protein